LIEAKEDGATTENVGVFMQHLIQFMIMALLLFWVAKGYSGLISKFANRTREESQPVVFY
jgi:large-conductance mechanosensitive channel